MKNRKTLKKLILGGLLLLTTGSVFAQTQKVHTLQAKNSSGTTTMNSDALIQMDSDNKGLLLPRIALTGANQVAPLTAHTAGMVVYNTANVPASGTGATAIEAVTEGYYYNNGTKWVKISSTDQNEWSYNPTMKQINLVRSGTAPFANKVLFNEKGQYVNYTPLSTPFSYYNYNTFAIETAPVFNPANAKKSIYNSFTSSSLETELNPIVPNAEYKTLIHNNLIVDAPASKPISVTKASINSVATPTTNSNSYSHIVSLESSTAHNGSGNVSYLIGANNGARLNRGSSSRYITGTRSAAQIHNEGTANDILNYTAFTAIGKANTINNVADFSGYITYYKNTSPAVNNSYSVRLRQNVASGASPTITNAAALYYQGITGSGTATITNNYGILLEDISEGTNNYAIYTKAGAIRFGDNVGIGTTTAPTEKLEVVGNGKFTGTVSTTGVLTTSDKRFKQGIKPVTSAIQTVNKLKPVSYVWSALGKENGGDNKKHIGFIAQEVEKVLPNLVNTNAKGYKSVNYIEVIPVLTKALQEQQKAIEKQQKEIDELKSMVKKLLK